MKVARVAMGPAVRILFPSAKSQVRNGDINGVEADDRSRMVGRRIVPTRWHGRCRDYHEMNGCRIPTQAVAS
jgi:hypothetical protein